MTEWRPIETAPKDGTSIIVWCGWDGPQNVSWSDRRMCWVHVDGGYGTERWEIGSPGWWMPLPPEPPEWRSHIKAMEEAQEKEKREKQEREDRKILADLQMKYGVNP